MHGASTSSRHNAIFGADDLNQGMLKGAIMDSSVGGCANAIKRIRCSTPSDRWYASAIKGMEQDAVQHAFEEKIAAQLGTFKRLGRLPKGDWTWQSTCTSYLVMTGYLAGS